MYICNAKDITIKSKKRIYNGKSLSRSFVHLLQTI